MIRRQLMRIFCLLLFLLCLGLWQWGATTLAEIEYGHHGYFVVCGTESGIVGLRWGHDPDWHDGWSRVVLHGSPARYWPAPDGRFTSFAGFSFAKFPVPSSGGPVDVRRVHLPLWFFAALSMLALVFLCRKPLRRRPGGAFPVELSANRGRA